MQRVLVLGCAGKSTFSRRLAAITGLPRVELDVVFWRPGWVQTPREEFLAIVAKLCEQPAWILDGNYSSSLHVRLPGADTVILLDYPRHLCLRRALVRIARDYGRVRKDFVPGCPERLEPEFLRYIWNFNKRTKPKILARLETHGSHTLVHRLASDDEAESFLAELSNRHAEISDVARSEA